MTLTSIIYIFINIGQKLIPFLGVVAFLFFVWNIAMFIKETGNGKEIKDTKNMLIWGVIGLFILVSIWGIISLLKSEVGFGGDVGIPQVRIP